MTMLRSCLAGVGLLSALIATPHAKGQTIPEAVLKNIGKLAAVWEIEAHSDGKVTKSKIEAKWNLDRTAIIYTGRGTDSRTNQPMSWTGLIGWDGKRKVIVEYSVSSSGELFHSRIKPSEKEWRSPTWGTQIVDGEYKPFKTLRIFNWKSEDEFEIVNQDTTVDGKPAPNETGVLRRVR